MSVVYSRSPEVQFVTNSGQQSYQQNQSQSDERPIIKLMRQNNSYLLQQTQSSTPIYQASNKLHTDQLTTLKQFQRSLEKQRPSEIQIPNSSFHNSIRKSSPSESPKERFREKFVTSLIINEQTAEKPLDQEQKIAFQHRVRQTQKYGNQTLDKIKKFIVDQKPSKSPKSPRKKKQPQLFCYNGTPSIDKLHKQHKKIESDRRDKYVKKYYGEQMKQIKPFKIINPTSQYLLQRRAQRQGQNSKPFYERSMQIAREKSQERQQKQLQIQQRAKQQQQEQYRKFEELRRQKYPNSGTKQRQEQFYNQLIEKEKIKNQVKQQQKIMNLKQITKQKPYVSKASKQLFNKIVDKNQIPRDFLERNYGYMLQRERQKNRELEKHDEEYCPFAPKISQASREMAKKYYERHQKKIEREANSRQKSVRHSKQALDKKLKVIEEKFKQKTILPEQSVRNHKRAISAYPLNQNSGSKEKPTRNPSESKSNRQATQPKTGEQKKQQIPIYNRPQYGKNRTNSCLNLSCRR